MTELEKLCEQALYEEIRDLGDGKSIVRDVPTGRLFYRKELAVYNLQVFSWLKDHKNRSVPRIDSFREEEGKLIVIEEYVQGRTLENLLEEAEDPLPFHERIRILTEICDGLSFLHSALPPIIHRDLKASNIMLTEDGVVKIIDYDAAKVYVRGEKQDTVLMGTHGIAAPEQYGFAPSDVRTDIYGLGKLIERLLPGNVDADRVVARATHIDPKKRYASAAQIREQILRIREHPSNLDTRLEKMIPGYDPRSKAHRVSARAAAAVLCVLILAAAVFSVWRFGIYPGQRRQAMTSQLKVIQSKQTQQEDLPGLIETYLTDYPYAKMHEKEQQQFQTSMEKVLSRFSQEQEIRQTILDTLSANCGEEAADRIRTYAGVEKLLSAGHYEKAFEEIQALRDSDYPGAGEKWAGALKRCYKKAAALEQDYQDQEMISYANRALKLYGLIASSANAEDPEEKEIHDKTVKAFEQLFVKVLEQADEKSNSGNFEEAEKIYTLLQELPAVGIADQTDLEEKKLENNYRKAESLFSDGNYTSALNIYKDLGDYSDSSSRLLECHYLNAEQYMEEEEYKMAVLSYSSCSGYKDADEKILQAKLLHCRSCAEKPDDEAYDYIEELTAAGYPGSKDVRDTMYTWHVEILNGISLLAGSQQSSHIRVNLFGGAPGASTHLRLETIDNVDGSSTSWTSPEAVSRGGHVDASYNVNTFEYSIFEREHTVKVYSDDGQLIGTWTGVFSKEFM